LQEKKTNRNNDWVFIGMGYITRANAEIVLLFTKGKPLERHARDVPQVLISPRGRQSEKPDKIRKRIVRLFGQVDSLELFTRQSSQNDDDDFDGSDVYVNEVDNSITISE